MAGVESENGVSEKIIRVSGGIFYQSGKILAAQRASGRDLAEYWEFPGGKIEAGESGREALYRELKEELQVEAEIGEFFARSTYRYSFGTVILDTYFCAWRSGDWKLHVHKELRWLAISELLTLQWAPADVPIIEKLLQEDFSAGIY